MQKSLSLFVFFCVLLLSPTLLFAQQWYKGNLHMHSYWSDGNVFAEQAIDWYKNRGYHFVSLTDHTVMQDIAQNWKEVGAKPVNEEVFRQYLERYGEDWVETKRDGDKTLVRLKPFYEFIDKLNIPDEFLVIPGHEQNVGVNGCQVHNNVINVVDSQPFQHGPTVPDSIRRNVAALHQYGAETGRDVLFISNHNCWIYFDIYPQDLIDVPEVRFFELLNCNPTYKPNPHFWTFEKFWDIINAFRLENKMLPLYGVTQDDTHNYLQNGPKTRDLGNYWVMVRAEKLDASDLIRAMYQGDFYCSNGVTLEDVRFDKTSKTLSVKVEPEEGVKYTIRFNGTRKGFDQSVTTIDDPAGEKKPARTIPVYSDQIGKVFQESEGVEASYTLADDDLYVRATIVSNQEANYDDPSGYMPTHQSAWTQPYFVK